MIRSVKMHQLGKSFVESVLDVRKRNIEDGKTSAPGESMEFPAQGLRFAFELVAGTDIFFIPREQFAKETPEQGYEGWWYQVWSVIWCKECRRCGVRKESTGFAQKEWKKKQPRVLSVS